MEDVSIKMHPTLAKSIRDELVELRRQRRAGNGKTAHLTVAIIALAEAVGDEVGLDRQAEGEEV